MNAAQLAALLGLIGFVLFIALDEAALARKRRRARLDREETQP